jgi:signal transduction histidine kinase
VGEFRSIDLRSIIDQSVKLIEHHLKMHNVAVAMELGSNPMMCYCDHDQIEQALLALEINAVEAMPEGGTLKIVVEGGEADFVRLSIGDTGIGIRDEDLPHIFEPFYTTKKDGKGTGLGLSVVYGIVERHGGTVNVQTKVQEGTTFTLSLPKLKSQPGVPG